MNTLLTILSALGGVAGAAGVAAFFLIPGAAPIISAVLSVAGSAIGRYITTLWKGLTTIVSNPAALVTAGTIAMVAFVGGFKSGREWDEYLVDRAKAQFTQFKDALRKADERSKQDAADAIEAREAAEEAERLATGRADDADAAVDAAIAGRLRAAGARARARAGGKGL